MKACLTSCGVTTICSFASFCRASFGQTTSRAYWLGFRPRSLSSICSQVLRSTSNFLAVAVISASTSCRVTETPCFLQAISTVVRLMRASNTSCPWRAIASAATSS